MPSTKYSDTGALLESYMAIKGLNKTKTVPQFRFFQTVKCVQEQAVSWDLYVLQKKIYRNSKYIYIWVFELNCC